MPVITVLGNRLWLLGPDRGRGPGSLRVPMALDSRNSLPSTTGFSRPLRVTRPGTASGVHAVTVRRRNDPARTTEVDWSHRTPSGKGCAQVNKSNSSGAETLQIVRADSVLRPARSLKASLRRDGLNLNIISISDDCGISLAVITETATSDRIRCLPYHSQ